MGQRRGVELGSGFWNEAAQQLHWSSSVKAIVTPSEICSRKIVPFYFAVGVYHLVLNFL